MLREHTRRRWTEATATATIGGLLPATFPAPMIETALVAFTTFFATIGVLLAALAVQFIFDGIAASGLVA